MPRGLRCCCTPVKLKRCCRRNLTAPLPTFSTLFLSLFLLIDPTTILAAQKSQGGASGTTKIAQAGSTVGSGIKRVVRRLIPGDTGAPQSSVDIPVAGSTVPVGTPVLVSGTARDFDGGTVDKVEISFDAGISWKQAVGGESWTYQWTPKSPGSFSILTRATDSSGNTEVPVPGLVVTAVQSLGNSPAPPVVQAAAESNLKIAASAEQSTA